ncbi:MAG: hypothetical protein ACR2FM_01395, partial [Candidatus Saccharimonadales bacterium]
MEPPIYHRLLDSQIRDLLGSSVDIPPDFQALLEQISKSYEQFEDEHKTIDAKIALRTQQLIVSTSNAYSFLDSLNMGFIMCDVDGEIVLSNSSVRRTLSSSMPTSPNPEWSLETINNLLSPELELKKFILECLATGKSSEFDNINFGKHVLR